MSSTDVTCFCQNGRYFHVTYFCENGRYFLIGSYVSELDNLSLLAEHAKQNI